MKSLALLIFLAVCIQATCEAPHEKARKVKGEIIAYSDNLGCLNGNQYGSMLFRIDAPKKLQNQLILIDFSLPCDESIKRIETFPTVIEFSLVPREEKTEIFDGSLEDQLSQALQRDKNATIKFPLWRVLPRKYPIVLPFGQVLSRNCAQELPIVPVL